MLATAKAAFLETEYRVSKCIKEQRPTRRVSERAYTKGERDRRLVELYVDNEIPKSPHGLYNGLFPTYTKRYRRKHPGSMDSGRQSETRTGARCNACQRSKAYSLSYVSRDLSVLGGSGETSEHIRDPRPLVQRKAYQRVVSVFCGIFRLLEWHCLLRNPNHRFFS